MSADIHRAAEWPGVDIRGISTVPLSRAVKGSTAEATQRPVSGASDTKGYNRKQGTPITHVIILTLVIDSRRLL